MMLKTDPIQTVLVGSGYGLKAYAPLLRASEGFQYNGLVRPWATRLGDQPILHHSEPVYHSLHDAADDGAGACILACPPSVMGQVAAEARSLGLHILIEKPCCASAQDAARLIDMTSDAVILPGYQFQYMPQIHAFMSALATQQSGSLSVEWLASSWVQENHLDTWKVRKSGHGGVITTLGVHILWLLHMYLDNLELTASTTDAAATSRWLNDPADAAPDTIELLMTSRQIPEIIIHVSNKAGLKTKHQWSFSSGRNGFSLTNHQKTYTEGFQLSGLAAPNTVSISPEAALLNAFGQAINAQQYDLTAMRRAEKVLQLVAQITPYPHQEMPAT